MFGKNNRAVTLVVLVVTIIILLILAVVSFRIIGGTDLIEKVENAVKTYNKEVDSEEKELKKISGIMDYGNDEDRADDEKEKDAPKKDEEEPEEEEEEDGVPYLPTGYSYSTTEGEENIDNGLVIRDKNGNECVWVSVPKTAAIYTTAGVEVTNFTDTELAAIETDLNNYTNSYKNNKSSYCNDTKDEFYSSELVGISSEQYNNLKKQMIKSIYKYEGFYVARYEAGSNTIRSQEGNTEFGQIPLSQANKYPINYVTCSQAQRLSSRVISGKYTSSLMFGLQWDLCLAFMKGDNGEIDDFNKTSESWGNYNSSSFNVSKSGASYSAVSPYSSYTAITGEYNKEKNNSAILTTGATAQNSKRNIFDLAGNVSEYTLEYSGYSTWPGLIRGGSFSASGRDESASYRNCIGTSDPSAGNGFRYTIFKTDKTTENAQKPYLPNGFTYATALGENSVADGLVIKDGDENEYVWVEVPKTANVYKTAGLEITSFTDDEYQAIESDLKTYTNSYRAKKGSDVSNPQDVFYSTDTTGLSEEKYKELKNKMLKSVYQNGGFYIAKYEAGSDTNRTANGSFANDLKPFSKPNKYPINFVTCSQAQTLASRADAGGYTSSLIFGVQWDLALKYMNTKGVPFKEQNNDSTDLGSYTNATFLITNTKAGYSANNGTTYESITESYTKPKSSIILTTGAAYRNSRQNIYDMAGNLWEFTLESSGHSTKSCITRGGGYSNYGTDDPVTYRNARSKSSSSGNAGIGFRVVIF